MRVLVTGGAGYVGSHVVRQLGEAGHEVVVYDNLSTGHRWAVLHGRLVEADLADVSALRRTLQDGFDAVLHFAAHVVVPESIADPLRYYANNTGNTLALLQACSDAGIDKVVFSSTAAVYGAAGDEPISEDAIPVPISPYGASKWMSERMLTDTASVSDLRHVTLRYFNVAGADLDARIGQATPGATHLIKVACEAAAGKRDGVAVFGTDYPTADGTCIRDYIHVEDLARAHLDALDYLSAGGASATLNCGYGHGHSVREVLDIVREVTDVDLRITDGARRPGDAPILVAACDRIRSSLSWEPRFDDLRFIVETAWRWEQEMKR